MMDRSNYRKAGNICFPDGFASMLDRRLWCWPQLSRRISRARAVNALISIPDAPPNVVFIEPMVSGPYIQAPLAREKTGGTLWWIQLQSILSDAACGSSASDLGKEDNADARHAARCGTYRMK